MLMYLTESHRTSIFSSFIYICKRNRMPFTYLQSLLRSWNPFWAFSCYCFVLLFACLCAWVIHMCRYIQDDMLFIKTHICEKYMLKYICTYTYILVWKPRFSPVSLTTRTVKLTVLFIYIARTHQIFQITFSLVNSNIFPLKHIYGSQMKQSFCFHFLCRTLIMNANCLLLISAKLYLVTWTLGSDKHLSHNNQLFSFQVS